jgi:hypothetical protein
MNKPVMLTMTLDIVEEAGGDDWCLSGFCCVDCGHNTAPGVPAPEVRQVALATRGQYDWFVSDKTELYTVHKAVWKKAHMNPMGGCLCIGCLEKRIGRKLRPEDFKPGDTFNHPDLPCTDRLRDRRGG